MRRTDRAQAYYRKKSNMRALQNVLLSYAMYNFDLGYVQVGLLQHIYDERGPVTPFQRLDFLGCAVPCEVSCAWKLLSSCPEGISTRPGKSHKHMTVGEDRDSQRSPCK